MSTDTTRARDLAAALLAEIANLRAAAPDDIPLLAVARAAQLCADVLAARDAAPTESAGGTAESPNPGAANAVAQGIVEPPVPDVRRDIVDPPVPDLAPPKAT